MNYGNKGYAEGYADCIEINRKKIDNYDSLLSALKSIVDDVKDWRDYNDSQADSFEGNEKKMVQDIATDITDRLRKALAAIKSAEQ